MRISNKTRKLLMWGALIALLWNLMADAGIIADPLQPLDDGMNQIVRSILATEGGAE